MEIPICPKCKLHVIPKEDGTCPNCHAEMRSWKKRSTPKSQEVMQSEAGISYEEPDAGEIKSPSDRQNETPAVEYPGMTKCQFCGEPNPSQRTICIHCSRLIKPEKKKSRFARIISGFGWIVAGVILIAADSEFDLSLFHLVSIPFLLSIIGVSIILYGLAEILGFHGKKK